MKVVIGILMVFLLTACQDKPKVTTHETEQMTTSTVASADTEAVSNLPCVSKKAIKKSPPVQDKSKIKAMLLKSGKITAEMTSEQADQIVNDFIRAKQNPSDKNCK